MTENKTYKASWSCPSNIALVKYWGKKNGQLPINPSLSFSLQNARTKTTVEAEYSSVFSLKFLFEGEESPFADRIEKYLNSLMIDQPWVASYSFFIESENSFPHSAGIASSASAFGALALCLTDLANQINGKSLDEEPFYLEASRLARLGSGSACRSMFDGFSIWGKLDKIKGSTDCYAIPVDKKINNVFEGLRDAILLVDSGKKGVSSSAGHQLMNEHPYKQSRIQQATKNMHELLGYFESGDLMRFFEVVENEALNLHALMMSSSPSFILLKPESLLIIDKIKRFREQNNIPIGFTIDAGPNIHLLYFQEDMENVHRFIRDELEALLDNKRWLDDRLGDGPIKLE